MNRLRDIEIEKRQVDSQIEQVNVNTKTIEAVNDYIRGQTETLKVHHVKQLEQILDEKHPRSELEALLEEQLQKQASLRQEAESIQSEVQALKDKKAQKELGEKLKRANS